MCFVKCFDIVTMVTDEATSQFAPLLQENDDKKDTLRKCCEMLDSVAEQFGGIAFEVDVNRDTTEISITLTCSEFEVDPAPNVFCSLLECAKCVRFKAANEEQIEIAFLFDGIWSSAL